MNITTFSSGNELIYSNTVIPFSKEKPEITINIENLILYVEFRTDTENTKELIESKVKDNKLFVTLVNFCNNLGTVFTDPMKLGKLKNRELNMSISVFSINGTHNITTINLFLGKEVDPNA